MDDPGLLRIKDENGSFVLDLDGKRVNPISLSSDQRKRLIDMLNIMRPWLEGTSAPASAPQPTAPPPPSADNGQRTTQCHRQSSCRKASLLPPNLYLLLAQQPAHLLHARPSTIAKEDRPAAPANSIVESDRLDPAKPPGRHTPGRARYLSGTVTGRRRERLRGLTRYNGIDDVPDPEIKAAIRAAISEWENKYTPGL